MQATPMSCTAYAEAAVGQVEGCQEGKREEVGVECRVHYNAIQSHESKRWELTQTGQRLRIAVIRIAKCRDAECREQLLSRGEGEGDGGEEWRRGRQGGQQTAKHDVATGVEARPVACVVTLPPPARPRRVVLENQSLHLLIRVPPITLRAVVRRQLDDELREGWQAQPWWSPASVPSKHLSLVAHERR